MTIGVCFILAIFACSGSAHFVPPPHEEFRNRPFPPRFGEGDDVKVLVVEEIVSSNEDGLPQPIRLQGSGPQSQALLFKDLISSQGNPAVLGGVHQGFGPYPGFSRGFPFGPIYPRYPRFPTGSIYSGYPGFPTGSIYPGYPGFPTGSIYPGYPGFPTGSINPRYLGLPTGSVYPGYPGFPTGSINPRYLGFSTGSIYPGYPEFPTGSINPRYIRFPTGSIYPGYPGFPTGSINPRYLGFPTGPIYPGYSGFPIGSIYPRYSGFPTGPIYPGFRTFRYPGLGGIYPGFQPFSPYGNTFIQGEGPFINEELTAININIPEPTVTTVQQPRSPVVPRPTPRRNTPVFTRPVAPRDKVLRQESQSSFEETHSNRGKTEKHQRSKFEGNHLAGGRGHHGHIGGGLHSGGENTAFHENQHEAAIEQRRKEEAERRRRAQYEAALLKKREQQELERRRRLAGEKGEAFERQQFGNQEQPGGNFPGSGGLHKVSIRKNSESAKSSEANEENSKVKFSQERSSDGENQSEKKDLLKDENEKSSKSSEFQKQQLAADKLHVYSK